MCMQKAFVSICARKHELVLALRIGILPMWCVTGMSNGCCDEVINLFMHGLIVASSSSIDRQPCSSVFDFGEVFASLRWRICPIFEA